MRNSVAKSAFAFVLGVSPLLATAAAYRLLGSIPRRRAVNVGDLYELEQRIFPYRTARGVRAVSEVVAMRTVYLRHHYLLDVLAGAAPGVLVHRALFGFPRGRLSRWLEARA
jgi:membrane-associated phospholipid phosphatase